MSSEIQSMHFRASKKQLSLHTGVYYIGTKKMQTFSTVSESLAHGPSAVWNFFESGHGKGVPDAVGENLKRKADSKVKFARDITSAKTFVDAVTGGETIVDIVEEPEKEEIQKIIDQHFLKVIPGTVKLHHIITKTQGEIFFETLAVDV